MLRAIVPIPAGPVAGTAESARGLADRLSRLDDDEQARLLADLVRSQVATVLGHADPADIDPQRPFNDLGFDSLAAVELRNLLDVATGLRLPATVIFDHSTPADLATRLHAELRSELDALKAPAPEPRQEADRKGPVATLLQQARGAGRTWEGIEFLGMISRLRPVFGNTEQLGHDIEFVQLSHGETPRLVCFPTVTALSSAGLYRRFAGALRGDHDLSVVRLPGFGVGEPVPGSAEAVVDMLAEAVRRHAGDEPFALLGHSAGGWLAHAVSSRLEAVGIHPAGTVLMDTYLPQSSAVQDVHLKIIEELFDQAEKLDSIDDTRLTAMGAYLRVFADWKPSPLVSPLLFLRASEPLGEPLGAYGGEPGPEPAGASGNEDPDWRACWEQADSVLDVPGDHFTMMAEHASSTARAVLAWLADRQ
jgi:thioesterase domain-containing protein/acyl carrier protein